MKNLFQVEEVNAYVWDTNSNASYSREQIGEAILVIACCNSFSMFPKSISMADIQVPMRFKDVIVK